MNTLLPVADRIDLVAKHFASMRTQHVLGQMVYPQGNVDHINAALKGTQEAWLAIILALAEALGVADKFDAVRERADEILLEQGAKLMKGSEK